jgi:hypothetical protein
MKVVTIIGGSRLVVHCAEMHLVNLFSNLRCLPLGIAAFRDPYTRKLFQGKTSHLFVGGFCEIFVQTVLADPVKNGCAVVESDYVE